MKTLYLCAFVCVFCLNACTKHATGPGERSAEDMQQKKANEFAAAIQNNSYQLSAFYSDKPIDFDQSDGEVKSETDLWNYVRPYLTDDLNLFQPEGIVTISQGDNKWHGDNSAQLQRNYSVSHDKFQVYFSFVDYNYDILKYTLAEYNSSYILVYVEGSSGEKLYSKFVKKNNP